MFHSQRTGITIGVLVDNDDGDGGDDIATAVVVMVVVMVVVGGGGGGVLHLSTSVPATASAPPSLSAPMAAFSSSYRTNHRACKRADQLKIYI